MPVQPCQQDGKPGYKYGATGVCYTYIPGNTRQKAQARMKAEAQAAAIRASQARAGKKVE
jgi:hypothetical protein